MKERINIKKIVLDITPQDVDGQVDLIITKEEGSKFGLTMTLDEHIRTVINDKKIKNSKSGKKIKDEKILYMDKFLNRMDISGDKIFPFFDLRYMQLVVPEYENFSNIKNNLIN